MTKQEKGFLRRQLFELTVGLSGLALTGGVASIFRRNNKKYFPPVSVFTRARRLHQ